MSCFSRRYESRVVRWLPVKVVTEFDAVIGAPDEGVVPNERAYTLRNLQNLRPSTIVAFGAYCFQAVVCLN